MKLLFLLFTLISVTTALKFLMYNPKSSRSHVGFVNNVADSLIDAGHEVVMYMQELDDNFGNSSNHKRAGIIERRCDFKGGAGSSMLSDMQANAWKHDGSVFTMLKSLEKLGGFFHTSCMHQLADEEMMNRLRNENFDLGFSEIFDVCGFGIFEKIGLHKYITLYSSILPSIHATEFGIPSTASYVPELHANSAPPYGFIDRFKNQFGYFVSKLTFNHYFIDKIAEAFAPNNISANIHDLLSESQILFVNSDELLDFPRPISHKIVQIGGMGVRKAIGKRGKLEKKYQDIFDNAKSGVIFISFGSVASSSKMPEKLKNAFLGAFKEFPEIKFIWKYEDEHDPIVQNIPNLVVGKWLPQKEIFAEEKLLGFVSHGGMNSIVEATTYGVPIIGIPLFADQYRNTLMAQNKGFGIKLDKDTLTKDILINAFKKVVNDPSFKSNAKNLAEMIANKPMSSDEKIVKFSEFAARFDVHSALDLNGRKLNTIQFYNIDVIISMLGIALLVLFIVYKLSSFIVRLGFQNIFKSKQD